MMIVAVMVAIAVIASLMATSIGNAIEGLGKMSSCESILKSEIPSRRGRGVLCSHALPGVRELRRGGEWGAGGPWAVGAGRLGSLAGQRQARRRRGVGVEGCASRSSVARAP